MRKCFYNSIIALTLIFVMFFEQNIVNAAEQEAPYYFELDNSNIAAINVYGGYDLNDIYNYAYYTENAVEIAYIIHYFNSFALFYEGTLVGSSDSRDFDITITNQDGTSIRYRLSGIFAEGYTHLGIPEDKIQYKTDYMEYARFMELIHAFKAGIFPYDTAPTFNASLWAEEAVEDAIQLGFVSKQNQINYVENITRLEFCQMVYALLKSQDIITEEPEVELVTFGDTLDPAVIALYHAGIVRGTDEVHFSPYNFITREELAVILERIYKLIGYTPSYRYTLDYTDSEQISLWAKDSVGIVSDANIMQGKEEMRFAPQEHTTKEEGIITLLRLYYLIK